MVSQACPIGKISRKGYNRKSYTKKSGKVVKATHVKRGCTKNMGMPGKTPSKKRVIKIPKNAEHLSKYGYKTSDKKADRLKALKKAVKKYGYSSVIHKLSALRTLTKKSQPSKSKKYNIDIKGLQEWKKKKVVKKKMMKGGDWITNTINNLNMAKNAVDDYFMSNPNINNSNNEAKRLLMNYIDALNNYKKFIFEMYQNHLNNNNRKYIREEITYDGLIKEITYDGLIKENKNILNNIYENLNNIYEKLKNIYSICKDKAKANFNYIKNNNKEYKKNIVNKPLIYKINNSIYNSYINTKTNTKTNTKIMTQKEKILARMAEIKKQKQQNN